MSDLNQEVMVDNVGLSDGAIYAADSAENVPEAKLDEALKDELLWQDETLIGKEDESTVLH